MLTPSITIVDFPTTAENHLLMSERVFNAIGKQ